MLDSFGTKQSLNVGDKSYTIYNLNALKDKWPGIERLPFSLKILLENLLRYEDGIAVKKDNIEAILNWEPTKIPDTEIAFHPARVLLQDFTGVPAVVDLAAMRNAMADMGGNPDHINPLQPVDLVIDHSVQVDQFGSSSAFETNASLEFQRNQERYNFLRWGQDSFHNFRVVPPDTGIVHQINLEYLGKVVFAGPNNTLYPDSLVGTDSHTTMINGLGILGWGVGGIEAEAAMLGQPLSMLIPQVVGFKLEGRLRPGSTATDLVLTVVQMLREKGVVGKFVEFYGSGMASLSQADRATIANMGPEYGATMGFFPVDQETLSYLKFTNRSKEQIAIVEAFCKKVGLFYSAESPEPKFSDTLSLKLEDVVPSLAGPKRPQDRIPLIEAKSKSIHFIQKFYEKDLAQSVAVTDKDISFNLHHGAVVIAAITSCTNTSNPAVMLGAGLLAKNAVAKGLKTKPWVKTSLAPGSKVVTDYLREADCLPALEALRFHVVGYGCTTCIGNSGPLSESITQAIKENDIVVCSVLSGNRNFEGRISPWTKMNFLASPPLVVAYALAGTTNIDFDTEAVGQDVDGQPVFLKDIWPSPEDVKQAIAQSVKPEQYAKRYAAVFDGDQRWQAIQINKAKFFNWEDHSTYIRKPPFFANISPETPNLKDIQGARSIAVLGDSVTTDHISPAGNIPPDGPAGQYLIAQGIEPKDFNSFGSRRGNHEVMMRGTFANIRLRNQLVPGKEGGYSVYLPSQEQTFIYDACMRYQKDRTPLVVLAGAEYGTGSSRDWAAKGTHLLGIKAVIAKSFERIHRSNLIGMGVLPLQFMPGEDVASLQLTGQEIFDIEGIALGLNPKQKLTIKARDDKGNSKNFKVIVRVDTPNEVDYYQHGGILLYVLRQLLKK